MWLKSSPTILRTPLLRRCWSTRSRAGVGEQQSAAEPAEFCRSSAPALAQPLPLEARCIPQYQKYCRLLHRLSLRICTRLAVASCAGLWRSRVGSRTMLDELSGGRGREGRGRGKEEACQPHISTRRVEGMPLLLSERGREEGLVIAQPSSLPLHSGSTASPRVFIPMHTALSLHIP